MKTTYSHRHCKCWWLYHAYNREGGTSKMIYFDNCATTAPNEDVLTSFIEVNRRFYANAASIHNAGKNAENLLNRSRSQIMNIVGLSNGKVILTSGGTEANNLAIMGIARAYRSRGKHIITTAIEHPSVLLAAKQLEEEGFDVDYLSVNQEGLISLHELESKLRNDTILVSIMHVNNEIGTCQPIGKCATIIKRKSRAIFHCDTVQSFGKIPVVLRDEGPDAITISAHKIHGLKGSGVLVLRDGIKLEAINYGGGQEMGHRSGTVSVPNAVALAKAMRLSVENNKSNQFQQWRSELIDFISTFEDVHILCAERSAPHILAIAFYKIKGEVAVNYFQQKGVIVSTSSACSSKSGRAGHVIEAIRIPEDYKHGVIRISFSNNNKQSDFEQFEKHFKNFMNLLERGKKYEME